MCVNFVPGSHQSTLSGPVTFAGVGLHTGETVRAIIQPAPADMGIVFRRTDRGSGGGARSEIHAVPENVSRADHGTTIANAFGASVATIEHLMAALAVSRIDNAIVELDGPEVPILDGSAAPFLAALSQAESVPVDGLRSEFVITERVEFSEGERSIRFDPADTFSLTVDIEFEDCLIGRQSLSIALDSAADIARLASARTFCRLYEVDALRRAGLIRGGSLENSLVIDGERLLNSTGLRDPHEFALHKALDLIGDLYLLGMPIRGAVHATRPGHDMNCRAAFALFRQREGVAEAVATA